MKLYVITQEHYPDISIVSDVPEATATDARINLCHTEIESPQSYHFPGRVPDELDVIGYKNVFRVLEDADSVTYLFRSDKYVTINKL